MSSHASSPLERSYQALGSDSAICVQNVSKIYKLYNSPLDRLKEALSPIRRKYHCDFHALHDVSFEVKRGEALGIIGMNGSGKSTLLKIITGVLIPSSGSVKVNGKISALLELGSGFNPELTGIENVYFSGTLMGYSKEEMDARLDNILSFANIGEFVQQPVKTYSSGMFVRLAFAVAVNVEPDILIIDEALAVGDLLFQRKCRAKMNQFKDEGATILLVSHSMSDLHAICDSAVFLNKGQMEYIGNTDDAIMFYTHERYKEEKKDFVATHSKPTELNIPTSYGGDIGGTNEIIISNVRCYQKNGDKDVSTIEFGENIIIEFNYKLNCKINKPVFRVGLSVIDYNFLSSFESYDCGLKLPYIEKDGSVLLEIQSPNLYPRAYAINVAVVTEEINSHLFFWNKAAGFVVKAKEKVHMSHPKAIIQLQGKMNLSYAAETKNLAE